jgi:hypothetical protein
VQGQRLHEEEPAEAPESGNRRRRIRFVQRISHAGAPPRNPARPHPGG